ncbi:MAG: hypothetical protein H0T62_08950 [Parachlamydiaceae bacterium]|nr:hypothetical protein [Parachlamydiaceae bacterium]
MTKPTSHHVSLKIALNSFVHKNLPKENDHIKLENFCKRLDNIERGILLNAIASNDESKLKGNDVKKESILKLKLLQPATSELSRADSILSSIRYIWNSIFDTHISSKEVAKKLADWGAQNPPDSRAISSESLSIVQPTEPQVKEAKNPVPDDTDMDADYNRHWTKPINHKKGLTQVALLERKLEKLEQRSKIDNVEDEINEIKLQISNIYDQTLERELLTPKTLDQTINEIRKLEKSIKRLSASSHSNTKEVRDSIASKEDKILSFMAWFR